MLSAPRIFPDRHLPRSQEIQSGDEVGPRMDVVIQKEVQVPSGQTNAMII